jgi:copper homeostasis protein
MRKLEIIATTPQDAIEAQAGGASTLEIVQNLAVGGLTPSFGMVQVIRAAVEIPIRVILRPHARDFMYSDEEVAHMMLDIDRLKQLGLDGIVFGALRPDNMVDLELTKRIVERAHPMEVTFHRAIDLAANADQVLPTLVNLVQRILTSGQANTVWEGRATIHTWVEQFGDRCIFACGGGIRVEQLPDLVLETAAPEFHLGTAAQTDQVVDRVKVAHILQLINGI